MMMLLGSYRFSLDTAAYQSKERTTHHRWVKHEQIGQAPALQFIGAGDDTLNLQGVIYPYYKGGLGQLALIRSEAAKGKPLMLIQGNGVILGQWVIESISETESTFFKNGDPKKIEFSLTLKRFDRKGALFESYSLDYVGKELLEQYANEIPND